MSGAIAVIASLGSHQPWLKQDLEWLDLTPGFANFTITWYTDGRIIVMNGGGSTQTERWVDVGAPATVGNDYKVKGTVVSGAFGGDPEFAAMGVFHNLSSDVVFVAGPVSGGSGSAQIRWEVWRVAPALKVAQGDWHLNWDSTP